MELCDWFSLRSAPQVGNIIFRRLVDHFGSPAAVLKASARELQRVAGIGPQVASAIACHNGGAAAEQEYRATMRAGVSVVTYRDPCYPALLREIADYPPYLYVKGELTAIGPAIAIVGSRRASGYGLMTSARLARELARQGVTVVSGMARGIDAAAHRGALEGGGKSIGVLGCGIDIVYPTENRRLFAAMAEQGALISEFPFGTLPLPENFPKRNRLISGISSGVLVVEATAQSGSLITAETALEQGRDVFAIPGNINSETSRGPNRLIKQGAKLVESAEDIMDELPAMGRRAEKGLTGAAPELDPKESALLGVMAALPLHIDEITQKSGLTVGDVSAILLRLELKGVVAQLPGKYFALP
jgi:DNA processing protein